MLKYTEWSQIQALNFLLDVKYYKSKRDNMNNNQSFSDCSQSKGSLWVERILRVVLASQRKMSEAGAKKVCNTQEKSMKATISRPFI